MRGVLTPLHLASTSADKLLLDVCVVVRHELGQSFRTCVFCNETSRSGNHRLELPVLLSEIGKSNSCGTISAGVAN